MALTITNHQIRSADTPHTANPGHGGWTVTWLPGGRVMAWPAAGYGVVAAAGPGGDEDEQA